MKFDAIVGNPPYQAHLGGASPLPIYHHFIENATAISPSYVSMITPSRWFNTGTGLDNFRYNMLRDRHLCAMFDYVDASECFSNVEIKGGIQYFLWNKDYDGKCEITTHYENGSSAKSKRYLLEPGMDSFIRNNSYISILNKVRALAEKSYAELISSRDPFGYDIRLPGSFKVAKHKFSLTRKCASDVEFYYNGWRKDGVGYVDPQTARDNQEIIYKYKVLAPKAWGTGNEGSDWLNPFVVAPGSVCTETYLVMGAFDTKEEADNLVSYIRTKFFHALVSLLKISQNAAKGVYELVPIQDFTKRWTDAKLYAKYKLSDDEIAFIEATIKPME